MRRLLAFSTLSAAAVIAACSSGSVEAPGLGTSEGAIYKGTPETATDAVMALAADHGGGKYSSCTGTVVAQKGSSGYMLIAAHCVVTMDNKGNPTTTPLAPGSLHVLRGPDYQSPTATYNVVEVKVHPSYTAITSKPYDFAMVRFAASGTTLPTVPPMQPAEDTLKIGSVLDLIGYGMTEKNLQNSVRHHASVSIAGFVGGGSGPIVELAMGSSASGSCHGDSGGPGMFGAGASRRVATVTSYGYGGDGCSSSGGGLGRVSTVFNSFVQPFIDGTQGALTCDECKSSQESFGSTCVAPCEGDTDCMALLDCFQTASTQDDAQKCFAAHPTGAAIYSKIDSCACDACSECKGDAACGAQACGFQFEVKDKADCGSCITSKCCAEDKSCFDDTKCNSCVQQGDKAPADCQQNGKYNAMYGCFADKCATECGISNCGYSFGVDGKPDCGTCLTASCCADTKACKDDAKCASCVEAGANPPKDCDDNAAYTGMYKCFNDQCGAQCFGKGGAGGAGGAGGKPGKAGAAGTSAGGSGPGPAGAAGSNAGGDPGGEAGSPATGGSGPAPSGSSADSSSSGSCSVGGVTGGPLGGLALALGLLAARRRRRA